MRGATRVVGEPTAAARYRFPFPDDEHTCEPLRRVQFAKLPRNALPPSTNPRLPNQHHSLTAATQPKRQPHRQTDKQSPLASPVSPAVQNVRRKRAAARPPETLDAHRHRLDEPTQNTPANEPWIQRVAKRMADEEAKEQLTLEQQLQIHELDDNARRQRDYDLYLYLSSQFGALDGFLYCSSPFPGHMYRRLVNYSARRLQQWLRKRVRALRRYWVVHLAISVTRSALTQGVEWLVHYHRQEQDAAALLSRFRVRRAATMLRQWRVYTSRMEDVRRRLAAAIDKDVRTRFVQWRERIVTVKRFKLQLKSVARRKAMVHAMQQWQEWKARHAKLRVHLSTRWRKMQRECLNGWLAYTKANKAARCIQRAWRLRLWRQRRQTAASVITKVVRGRLTRARVRNLRQAVDIGRVVLQLVESTVWVVYHEKVVQHRTELLARESIRAERERAFIQEAESQAGASAAQDLSAVVRNAMHQKLKEQMRLVQESGEPGAIQGKTGMGHDKLRRLAVRQLLEQERTAARGAAAAAFRARSAENRPLATCLICAVQFPAWEQPAAAFLSVPHACIDSSALDFDAEKARSGLTLLNAAEVTRADIARHQLMAPPGHVRAFIDARTSASTDAWKATNSRGLWT